MVGHDAGNGRREGQTAIVLEIEEAVIVRPREEILEPMVVAVCAIMTLEMRADTAVILPTEIIVRRTEMSAPVAIRTTFEMRGEIKIRSTLMTGLVEMEKILLTTRIEPRAHVAAKIDISIHT